MYRLKIVIAAACLTNPLTGQTANVEELAARLQAMETRLQDMQSEIDRLRSYQANSPVKISLGRADSAPIAGGITETGEVGEPGANDVVEAATRQPLIIQAVAQAVASDPGIVEALEQRREAKLDSLEKRYVMQNQPVATVPNLEAGSGTRDRNRESNRGVISANDDLVLSFGGFARADGLLTDPAIGSSYRFITAQIPIQQDDGNDYVDRSIKPFQPTNAQANISARLSRFNFEALGNTNLGVMKAFIEGDFLNDDSEFRLRHAYGEVNGWLMGQTWGTFLNMGAHPDIVDSAGPSAMPTYRTPMVRYTFNLDNGWQLRLAAEESRLNELLVADAIDSVSNNAPDIVGSVMARGGWGNVMIAGAIGNAVAHVSSGLEFEGEPISDAGRDKDLTGHALGISGALRLTAHDELRYQFTVVDALSHYISDLEHTGTVATFDGEGNLETLESMGVFVAYQHKWNRALASTISYSEVEVEDFFIPDLDGAPDQVRASYFQSFKESRYASINLMWRPDKRLQAGIEFLYGRRKNTDGRYGTANRINMMATYNFD